MIASFLHYTCRGWGASAPAEALTVFVAARWLKNRAPDRVVARFACFSNARLGSMFAGGELMFLFLFFSVRVLRVLDGFFVGWKTEGWLKFFISPGMFFRGWSDNEHCYGGEGGLSKYCALFGSWGFEFTRDGMIERSMRKELKESNLGEKRPRPAESYEAPNNMSRSKLGPSEGHEEVKNVHVKFA